ncbi:hypothetical protein DSL64_13045 [Dyadobacter luteus]|uniref:Serine protease n=1 Tax=Dyadobacter luteus TaxID=2259619 RepID=A0A3D8YAK3_9BACT|nr:serine protease [Dyadobacter luteus]REA60833.1 hypothetical protein DSL64_13045 [Dyadobacter luteus]
MRMPTNFYLKAHKPLIKEMFDFFTFYINNVASSELLKETILEDPIGQLEQNHKVFINMGYLTRRNFEHWHFSEANSNRLVGGLDSHAVDETLKAFVDIDVLKYYYLPSHHKSFLYTVNNIYLALLYTDEQLLFNRLFGFQYISKTYTASVFKIVNFKDDEQSIGNGFLIMIDQSPKIVTNYHVLEGADRVVVYTDNDKVLNYEIEKTDKDLDLALLKLETIPDATPFRTLAGISILDEILTIGYPPVSCASNAHPVYHLGEVNSDLEDYWGRTLFLFSAKTNPGNSGGPIIGSDGRVVGIITEQLEE